MSKTFFIYKNFFINSVSFCYCGGSYGPPDVFLKFKSKFNKIYGRTPMPVSLF